MNGIYVEPEEEEGEDDLLQGDFFQFLGTHIFFFTEEDLKRFVCLFSTQMCGNEIREASILPRMDGT